MNSFNLEVKNYLAELNIREVVEIGDKFSELLYDELSDRLAKFGITKPNTMATTTKPVVKIRKQKQGFIKISDIIQITDDQIDSRSREILHQPNGSQKSPDILIKYDGLSIKIEAKTSKNSKITWNGGLPEEDTIYIYNNYNSKIMTYFLGSDVLTTNNRSLLRETHQATMKSKIVTETNSLLKNNGCNVEYYVRAMYVDKTNYENNTKRDEWRISVEKYLDNILNTQHT